MIKKPTLLSCPFCGGVAVMVGGDSEELAFVTCKHCRTEGPTAATVREAAILWNRRHEVQS